ncbi:MAG: DEAD/DEAH box helicase [Gemmataceae bacterium]|nr:DEAD/DEAH box helicase [Gemmataceae bacterium]
MDAADPLDLFLPPVRQWFRSALGEPTAAQRDGWPAIVAGQHTLVLAPTGSGKTLAAFLACLDRLWRQETLPRGVQVLYISPLKALNNDIQRNLQVPLTGVTDAARQLGLSLPAIESAVRTGDTPTAERQRLIRQPPHVLITTPESLHLLLTSRGRDTLRQVKFCIVDEIHALCANKRGVFLALLLERLQALNPHGFVRIGLSATQRPLEEVARYLGGCEQASQPRPVTIVNAGLRKDLDLRVISPVQQFGPLPEGSVWPSIYRLLGDEIRRHRSTIVFANNRRSVERITAHLNDNADAFNSEPAGSPPTEVTARAHHGSVALEVRQQTEQALKEGRLPAVVATASLELGIDMGAVDLVCQVESPGSVARGLQRVGRAGHIVGQKSKGRLIPKTPADLIEQAVLAREMVEGHVEAIRCPINCLDVLAQQVVAATAMEPWEVPELYALVRRAYPFRDLTPAAFESVLEMVSGRYRFGVQDPESALASQPGTPAALQARVSWDRIHNRLHALPGSQQLALVNGGTIPDTGQYATYTGGVRIGELDEEFIYERRIGDTFLLGTNAWRIDRIEADRVLVSPAAGAPAMAPFWRGEMGSRTYDLGCAMGRFLRELSRRIDAPDCLAWLERDHFLDAPAARNLRYHVRRQLAMAGDVPTDRLLLIEASRDPLGDWQVILLSPFGGRLHLALRLAIEHRLSQRLGYRPQCLHHNDGLLIRLADTDEPVLDLFDGLTAESVEAMILEELADSALFALRFRQNAARALLLPRGKPGKRAPLWLQRLRGRDLLQVARRHPDFPIVAETFRECLHDHLDVPRLQELLQALRGGEVQVRTRRADAPSPFASGLLFDFTAAYMYDFDRAEPAKGRSDALDRQLLEQLVAPDRNGHLLDPRAVHQVERRLRGLGQPPRSVAEMAEWLRRLGDLAPGDQEGPMAGFLEELERDGRARRLELPGCREPQRWVLTEEEERYQRAFGLGGLTAECEAAETILARFLSTHALVGLRDVLARYPFDATWARRQLEAWTRSGRLIFLGQTDPASGGREPSEGRQSSGGSRLPLAPDERWSIPENLEQMQRGTLALLRREVVTCPPPQFADYVLRWQHLHPSARRGSADGLVEVLDRLQGLPLPAELWEQCVLPGRVPEYQPRWLDEQVAGGAWVWTCQGEDHPGVLAFWRREHLAQLPPPREEAPALDAEAELVLERLHHRGASFLVDLAQDTRDTPTALRSALNRLLRRRLVTNDRFDVVRRGGEPAPRRSDVAPPGPMGLSVLRRRAVGTRRGAAAEGRWSCLHWGRPEPEEHAVFLASLLLERYGVVARELALMDPWMLPWRVLYEVLTRMELSGEVRRGYFVEGLSGAQFALPEAVQMLQDTALPSTVTAPVLLVHSLDPANLYGSGAPFDIPLLDGGTRPLLRRAGNWLVLRAGRPVLIIEQQGKKLTALPSASREDVSAAVTQLPGILAGDRGLSARHKLSVVEWNGQPVTGTEGRELLEAAGFVRDYQQMTLYAAWR